MEALSPVLRAGLMISPIATLEDVDRDIQATLGALRDYLRVPDDEEPTRPLYMAVEALMRAVSGMRAVVEQEQAYRRGTSDRIGRLEYRA
jgi:hypothetical protein